MPLSLDFLCLQGLRHLHETGKMHRDIKVMYILLDIKTCEQFALPLIWIESFGLALWNYLQKCNFVSVCLSVYSELGTVLVGECETVRSLCQCGFFTGSQRSSNRARRRQTGSVTHPPSRCHSLSHILSASPVDSCGKSNKCHTWVKVKIP